MSVKYCYCSRKYVDSDLITKEVELVELRIHPHWKLFVSADHSVIAYV